ncbi:hypothetical protein A1Q1_04319 [Trichosporon asahii var. asahii CBS 2479]|uniref:Uncharacterized protein n=1 Tax=Trichosporon asahii var. asahii (strain ATCC 90039 / CBS 2479 / JCM 2466 / KCTC 7840 / NBRC 103889/ NCYC 2677 / UAMH 7654) TaxID=1186058 RepID=J6EVU4_TRIAS|nr:hypothetical protein A1Q1_04319 [Trichosporon asahii var. asahii CBS 2479]EJT46927.1 hypothetical protein A1Q1_04319 [Trichosporon asahii var. asahii CBS 2479]
MFGLTQLSALSLLALSAVAQDNAAASATSMVASADPAQSGGKVAPSASAAGPATSGGAVEDGPDGNDVTPESGGTNPGWNSTYFYAPSNSKAYGFWVNGIENRAIWNPVNITTRLVLTNSRKDFWAGEKELQTNIAGGIGEWKGMIGEDLPTGHNYLLALYDMTSGSKLGQTSGFTMRMNGTIAPPPHPGAPGASSSASNNAQPTDGAQQSGGNAPSGSASGAAGESSAAAPAASQPGGAARLGVSGAAAAAAVAVYVLA